MRYEQVEQILEIAEEAGLDIVWETGAEHYQWVEGTKEQLLQFAKSLILKCAQIDAEANDVDYDEDEPTYNQVILQHFGVKNEP